MMNSSRRSRSGAVQKPVSIKRLAGAVLVLVAAVGIGMGIREFRFRSWDRQLTQAQKTARPDVPKTAQAPKEPEIQSAQEQSPAEDVIEPEPPAPQDVSSPMSSDAGQSTTPVQAEMPAPQPERDSRFEDPAAKERRGREALALIGHDPAADAVWVQMINDPTLSASARANLIEDLNEDGLQYRNLTTTDLPVIQYRIELVEYLRPYAMDKVNADAFDEAYKDLVNMEARLTGR